MSAYAEIISVQKYLDTTISLKMHHSSKSRLILEEEQAKYLNALLLHKGSVF